MKLAIDAFGAGPPVAFLHGTPTPPEAMYPLAKVLATSFQCLVVHSPGYGRSDRLRSGFALGEIHDALEDTLAEWASGGIRLVGYSAGAYHALAIGTRSRLPVTRVVCLAGLCGLPGPARTEWTELAHLVRAGFDARPLMPQRMLAPEFAASHPALAAEVQTWLDATDRETLADELEAFAVGDDLAPRLVALRTPVLVRSGANDVAAPVAYAEAIAAAAPRATLEIVPGAGHALVLEDLPATAESVRAFLMPPP